MSNYQMLQGSRKGLKKAASKFVLPVVFVLGMGLSWFSFLVSFSAQEKNLQSGFQQRAQQEIHVLENALEDHFEILHSVQLLYLVSDVISRDEFRTFTQPLLKRLPSLLNLAWAPAVYHKDRANFEASMKKEGYPDFHLQEYTPENTLKDESVKDVYYPIQYVVPEESNLAVLGRDQGSDRIRLEAIQRAQKSGELTMSAPTHLVQFPSEISFLMFQPLVKSKVVKQNEGFIEGTFRFGALRQLVRQRMPGDSSLVRFKIEDITDPSQPLLIYSDTQKAGKRSDKIFKHILGQSWNVRETFQLPGRVWRVEGYPNDQWNYRNFPRRSAGVFFLAFIATSILTLYLRTLLGRTKKIEEEVQSRTEELRNTNAALTEQMNQKEKAEEKLRALVGNVPGVIYRCAADKDWTMEYISEAIHEITGYPASDFLNSQVRTYDSVIHPEDQLAVEEGVWLGLQNHQPYVLEYSIINSNGQIRWVYEKGQGIFSKKGDVLYLDGAIFDITERRHLQEQVLQSQKMEAVGQLAGGVAHDFNNQLMVIKGYSELLMGDMNTEDPRYQEIMEIKKAADKSAQLTKQLLAFGRKQVLVPKVFRLQVLIQDMTPLMQSVLGEKNSLVLNLSSDFLSIKADPNQIEQVLINLLVNARDAMPDGGTLTIRVSKEQKSVKLKEDKNNCYGVLEIQDNGTGMSEEVRKHLFEPFFTTKEKGKGTGLGLSTCYGIVRSLGGFIEVNSEAGKGSCFKIYLPVSFEPESLLVAQKKNLVPPRGTESILIVEDEEAVRRVGVLILKEQGYQVFEAKNGKEALEFLKKSKDQKVDLLLTDLVMPEMNGRELADAAQKLDPQLKVLMVSGYTDDVVVRYGVQSSKRNFLQKPFSPKALAFKVREVLDATYAKL